MHTYSYTHIHAYIFIQSYIHAYIFINTYSCIHIHTLIYSHTLPHTCTHKGAKDSWRTREERARAMGTRYVFGGEGEGEG